MWVIFQKEFAGYLHSLIAYMVIGVFLTAIGLLMWVFPDTSVLDYGYADMGTLFSTGPYVLLFLIPGITMRSFAEEKRMGTMELLLTKPLTDWQLVFGKFMAAWALVAVALAPTLIYYYSVYQLGSPTGNVDTAGVMGSYVGLFLLSAVFCSAGMLASSFTVNQIVAFMMAAFLCFLLYTGFDSLSALPLSTRFAWVLKQVGIVYHYESLSRGLIDSRDVVYFVSMTGVLLVATKTSISSRQW
jgi:ABC-2 type transport system permease protein